MDFKTYQKKARETAQYPDLGSNNIYPTLGLVGEAGEVAEKVKKVIRDKNGIFDNDSKLGIKKELGDVLWYVSNLCTELNFNLQEVALQNLEKLKFNSVHRFEMYHKTSPNSFLIPNLDSLSNIPFLSLITFFTFSATSPASPTKPRVG